MSKFVMKTRPKKPTQPTSVQYEVGECVSLAYLNECVEKFKTENPGLIKSSINVEVEENWSEGWYIFLTAPPESYNIYLTKLNQYNITLKEYKEWQKKNKKSIETHKARNKTATAKRKLERTRERLMKEMKGVESKLAKT